VSLTDRSAAGQSHERRAIPSQFHIFTVNRGWGAFSGRKTNLTHLLCAECAFEGAIKASEIGRKVAGKASNLSKNGVKVPFSRVGEVALPLSSDEEPIRKLATSGGMDAASTAGPETDYIPF